MIGAALRGLATVVAIVCLASSAGAQDRVELPEDVRLALSPLGEGTVGPALPARPIDDPAALRHLAPGTWTYEILDGANAGQIQRVTVARVDADDPGAGFRVETGDEDIQTLVVTADHEVLKTSQTDLRSDRIVTYRPGLVLEQGMKAGEEKTVERQISTYKTKRPEEIEYNGELRYTTRYIGMYRVHTPAGSFDARLLEHAYEMKIGPATAKNQSYDFYADGIGNVAAVSRESVSAVLIYRRSSTSARVLVERPKD